MEENNQPHIREDTKEGKIHPHLGTGAMGIRIFLKERQCKRVHDEERVEFDDPGYLEA